MDFTVPADHRVKLKESEKKNKYVDPARILKKIVEQESDDYTNYNWRSWYSRQSLVKGLKDLEITGRVETIQITALLRSVRIPRRVLES